MKKWVFIGVLTFCSAVYAGEIADLHHKMVETGKSDTKKSRTFEEIRDSNHGITEIGLERTHCYGFCPVYTVVIKSDGTLRYKGEANVKMKGERTGQVDKWQFDRLAQFIRDAGYMELENDYWLAITDNATVYTTVVMNGRRKVIRNYANAGPPKLWAIEQLIDKLMSEAKWDDEQAPNK